MGGGGGGVDSVKLISGEFGKECIKLVEPARVLVTLHLYICIV